MPSNFTLQNSVDHARTLLRGLPLATVLSVSNEPALTMGNLTKAKILSPPFPWPWNRTMVQFLLTPGAQDNVQNLAGFGWFELCEMGVGALINSVALGGNVITYQATNSFQIGAKVNVAGVTALGGTLNAINAAVIAPTSATQFSIAGPSGTLGPTGVNGTAYQVGSNFLVTQRSILGRDVSAGGRPQFFAVQNDDNANNITMRFNTSPDQAYLATLTYQNAPVPFTALTGGGSTWTPMPDARMQHVYLSGFKALCFQRASDSRYPGEWQNFLQSLVDMATGLTKLEKDLWLTDEMAKMRTQMGDRG